MKKIFPFLFWLGVASYFIFGLGLTLINEQENRLKWPKYEATIIDTIVRAKSYTEGSTQMELHLKLQFDYRGKKRILTAYKTTGRSTMEGYAQRQYPKGSKIDIYINPENPNKYLFEIHHSWGPYLAGFLPGLFFFLIALSTLFSKEKVQSQTQSHEN